MISLGTIIPSLIFVRISSPYSEPSLCCSARRRSPALTMFIRYSRCRVLTVQGAYLIDARNQIQRPTCRTAFPFLLHAMHLSMSIACHHPWGRSPAPGPPRTKITRTLLWSNASWFTWKIFLIFSMMSGITGIVFNVCRRVKCVGCWSRRRASCFGFTLLEYYYKGSKCKHWKKNKRCWMRIRS